jgi:hypothetical protein
MKKTREKEKLNKYEKSKRNFEGASKQRAKLTMLMKTEQQQQHTLKIIKTFFYVL